MKRYIFRLMLFAAILVASLSVYSQPQNPPPPPAGGHGQSTNQSRGGGAPLGTGIGIMLALGGAYGAKKVYDARKNSKE
ncbi:MAG TPA: hypothetical protein PK028_00850 [Bacteroidales bacterium]|jgi:hypothetical protein|nr:hypothetical protein [Bacteroidales bacterium]MDI9573767.1 hypothetical protein [Bacteroidota bacterium]OQC61273.1 MAG: hypothetical protein BWX51_00451 [Bacteroidetes bacterium ADurb.Bin012]MBP9511122.1 hypothetical protein [Bacteroidales bacterium]MBP9589163.1 hypothetical protein [Bacteroidales bacterium]